jgi:hypothetical protein
MQVREAVYFAQAGIDFPPIDPGASGRTGGVRSGGTAMQTEAKESNLSTILWTAAALAVVVIVAIYMGMR